MKKKKIIIGLTGGFATGKTTVLAECKLFGADIIDSDMIVHDILNHNIAVQKKIFAVFGDVADKNNRIDRKKLGSIVFNKRTKLVKLERLIHPLVKRHIAWTIQKSKKKIIVADVPLLFEARMQTYFDYIVTAYCPKRVQIQRAIKRGRLTRRKALKLISLQLPMAYKIKHSDFVINTNRTKQNIKQQVSRVIEKLN
jgi:dephospho-CoA kinase